MALPGTSTARKCFLRNPGGHGATPSVRKVRASHAAVKGSGLDAAKRGEREYAGLVAFQDK